MTQQALPQPARPSRIYWYLPAFLFAFFWWGVPAVAPALAQSWLTGETAAWLLVRASGVVAYALLSLSTIWGLLLSTRLIKTHVPAPVTLALHNTLSWTSLAFTGTHVYLLLFDRYFQFTVAHLLVPFTGPYAPFWVGLGTVALYAMVVTTLSWNWRKRIGQKNWRRLHYLTFVAYLFATVHGIMAGTDTALLSGMYVGSAALIVFLTAFRILAARQSAAGRATSAA